MTWLSMKLRFFWLGVTATLYYLLVGQGPSALGWSSSILKNYQQGLSVVDKIHGINGSINALVNVTALTNHDTANDKNYHYSNFRSEYHKEKASSPPHSNCSCWNSPQGNQHHIERCCRRLVISTHKFGMAFSSLLFKPYRPYLSHKMMTPDLFRPRIGHRGKIHHSNDYRHVAVVRNVYEAVVSGYLYHRSGHECWVDMWGRNWTGNALIDWEARLNASMYQTMIGSYPSVGNRDLCEYLVDETEIIGMKLYIAYALHWWYDNALHYMERAMEASTLDNVNRTLFLCLEYASGAETEEAAFFETMDFLFLGGHNYTYPTDRTGPEGHSTDQDPVMRLRLRNLVHELDRTTFNGALAKVNSHINCSEHTR